MLIDIHCHILPEVDDGALDLLECLDMANTAVGAGINHLFATPHHMNGQYINKKNEILARVTEVNKHLQQETIPLTIHPGQEVRIHQHLIISLEMDEVLTLDNRGKYLLLELPSGYVPIYTQEVIYQLLMKGITPIIVHPERNRELIEDPHLLFQLVQQGALTQLTSGSVIGLFGKKIKSFSEKIIEHHLAHFIATDAHNVGSRGFSLQEAFETITKTYGIDHTLNFKENALTVLQGQSISIEPPIPIRKKILGIF
ncbi:tyrosine-protein phosphatase [Peribacillus huizhouensis]|uniref:Tyrosine-protein phosphatase n=1 Tax=Peribacillus huizhouensis TaxID=1501239 RepID=A0ABR6CLY2_9BACI|nr:CpsB/CapC family capsule biosynthesis tyrosine phosphatase [Peribacillus huizhouensis]MBA9025663.1 protein-tyrosine phosphatase [Peribacillus huizhouensis]